MTGPAKRAAAKVKAQQTRERNKQAKQKSAHVQADVQVSLPEVEREPGSDSGDENDDPAGIYGGSDYESN